MMNRFKIFIGIGACVLGVGLLLVLVGPCNSRTAPQTTDSGRPPPPIPGRRALLVGVTQYDHLPRANWLNGPGNDVAKLRYVLTSYYRFPTDDVVCLTEAEKNPSRRPTRENIEREFRRLAEVAREGDQVFVLIAGHGDRQPESPPTNREFRQADGISEIFLPADVRPAAGSPLRAPNAVADVEFRAWLAEIIKKKAYVWVVFDCCHSGDLSRGLEDVRELPPGVLVPTAALEQARKDAGSARGGRPPGEKSQSFHPNDDSDHLVALYACRPTERTLELDFPVAKVNEWHGILSHTLAEVLTDAAAVRDSARPTYRDILRRINLKYAAHSGWAATPTIDGTGQDRFLFGENKPYIPQFQVTQTKDGYRVNAGDFHGLTTDSVLRVYKPGNTGPQPEIFGYARVVSTTPFESVVEPCAFPPHGKVDGLPRLATCDVERTAFKIPPLKVAVVSIPATERTAGAVRDAVKKTVEKHSPLIALADNGQGADWLIRCDGDRPALVDATGNRPAAPLPAADDPEFGDVLGKKLLRIYRAQSLVAVGDRLESERRGQPAKVGFELTLFRTRPGEKEEPVPLSGQDLAFFPGESVRLRVRNTSEKETIDVALLIVGSDYKITSFYPGWKLRGKDIEPGKSIDKESEPYSDDPPFGSEYLVAIAVPARNRVDFSALIQPGLKDRGYGDDSPLAQLLERALDGLGTRSALDRAVIAENAVRVVSWRTVPARKDP
jgi:hypothetical protein